jgi:hypothetical protein
LGGLEKEFEVEALELDRNRTSVAKRIVEDCSGLIFCVSMMEKLMEEEIL